MGATPLISLNNSFYPRKIYIRAILCKCDRSYWLIANKQNNKLILDLKIMVKKTIKSNLAAKNGISKVGTFRLSAVRKSQREAIKLVESLQKQGYNTRIRAVAIKGKSMTEKRSIAIYKRRK